MEKELDFFIAENMESKIKGHIITRCCLASTLATEFFGHKEMVLSYMSATICPNCGRMVSVQSEM